MRLVDLLDDECSHYKVGLELLTAAGPEVVRQLVARGKEVFLDLKLHEIPNSVASAVKVCGELGVSMVTVHASAGSAVLRAAVGAAAAYPQLRVLALTVITSLGDDDLPEIGLEPSVRNQVARLSQLALASGCHGVVASVAEARYLSAQLPPGQLIVTPGIQLPGDRANDQLRTATPQLARAAGATHLIIGRSITQSREPLQAYRCAMA
jgi:orotidine-5'-phosphate decarboxylase